MSEIRKLNMVEVFAIGDPDEDCQFDQPCAHGHRVGGHAVYCHNTEWKDSPRKCHRYQGNDSMGNPSDFLHEDCPGFKKNKNAA